MSHFKTVAVFRDVPLAELAKAKLESEGIYCHLLNTHHISMNWMYSFALGGIKVQVRADDAAIAKQILSSDESSFLEKVNLDLPDLEAQDLCIYCGSPNLELIKYSRLSAILIMLTGLPFIFWGTRYKCKDCGKKSKIKIHNE